MEEVVLFCRTLRDHGLAVTPSEVVDAVTTLRVIDASDHEEAFLSLRSVLTSRVEDFPIFEELFNAFWNRVPKKLVERETSGSTTLRAPRSSPEQASKELAFFLEHWTSARSGDAEPVKVPGASDAESDADKDFKLFGVDELDEIARLARRIVKRLARNP